MREGKGMYELRVNYNRKIIGAALVAEYIFNQFSSYCKICDASCFEENSFEES